MNKNNKVQDGFEEGKQIESGSIDNSMLTSNIEYKSYFQQHLKKVFNLYEDSYFKSFISSYKSYHLDTTDRAKALESKGWDWRTNVKYPLTKMNIDTLFANFYDTQISYKLEPRNPSDYEKTKFAQGFFEWIMDVSRGNGEIFKAAKEAMICGTSFLKVIVKKTVEKGTYLKKVEKGKKIYGKYNNEKIYPSMANIDIFSLFIDPSASSIDNARFVYQRKILPYKDAFEKYGRLLGIKLTKEERNTILKSPEFISNKDYSKVKKLPFFKEHIQNNIFNFNWANFFEIGYSNNDLIEVIEYYEKGKMSILFNGYIIYDGVSIYPFEGYPFTKINYELDTGSLYTKGIGTNLEPFQNISDIILNSYLDQVKLNVAPMYEADKGSVNEKDIGSGGQLKYVPFKIILKRDNKPALKPIPMTNGDRLGLESLQSLQQYVEMSEGPNQYSMGGTPIERSATGASLKANITKQRLKPLVDSINRSLSDISEKILLLASTVYEGEIPIRLLGEQGEYEYKNIVTQEIIGQYNIIFETNSLKSVIKEVEKNQLLQFLTQAMPASVDQARQRPVVDTMKLFRNILQRFDLPEDILLTDKNYKDIIGKSMASAQEGQIDAKKIIEEYNKQQSKSQPEQQPQQPEQQVIQPEQPQQQLNQQPQKLEGGIENIYKNISSQNVSDNTGGNTLGALLSKSKRY